MNKERVRRQSALLKERGLTPNPSFEVMQTILKLVVDKIKVNVNEGWFEIEGILPGHFDLNESIAGIPVDRDTRNVAFCIKSDLKGMILTPANLV